MPFKKIVADVVGSYLPSLSSIVFGNSLLSGANTKIGEVHTTDHSQHGQHKTDSKSNPKTYALRTTKFSSPAQFATMYII
ncbi:hypothetical protein L3Y34_002742 [Caenorhabditis briggsae]|uniref:Uncharacterized protein n=1 Tax=Caenorhabditis briggsae TaxID=6238 RepID=A0AAE9DFU5_CAEBR|nr:hypothetical protein L3Y34_002742 [Caenorhabditis briggsae]